MGVRARGLATGGLALLAVAGLIVAARRARLEPLLVRGDSMRPTLDPGQRIAVGPVRGALRRGEVVLLRRAGLEMVKRVVGLPGEHVRLLDVRLGGDELAVLGDSRGHSTDSRSFGAVPSEDVIGIVRFAYWPPRRVRG